MLDISDILCPSSGVNVVSHVTVCFIYAWCRPLGEQWVELGGQLSQFILVNMGILWH